jgi:DNA-binding NarL/FixJ family response regulator
MTRVVLIDDNDAVRASLHRSLHGKFGIEVVGAAASGRKGLAFVAEAQPDVVMIDCEMPDMDGPTTTRLLRSLFPHIAVIAYSGDPANERRARDAGAVDFLVKPSRPERIVAAILSAPTQATKGDRTEGD